MPIRRWIKPQQQRTNHINSFRYSLRFICLVSLSSWYLYMQFHFYADDTQLYISFSTNDDLELTNSIVKIEKCLSDLDQWMSLNKLKLNKDKTELLYLYSKYCPQQSLPPLRFGSDTIQPSLCSRNIGVVFDSTISMLPHVN